MPKIFSSFLSGFNVILKKKKKGHRADGGIFSSDCMLISKKKKVFRLSSASFFRNLCDISEWGAVKRSCLRFLAGNKNAGFGGRKNAGIRKISVRKCQKKFCTFLGL